MVSTVEAIRKELTADGFVYRYHAEDGLPGGEGTFLVCSFWLVDNLIGQGRLDSADTLDHDLDVSGKTFLNSGGVRIDREADTVWLPQVFHWYGEDFGRCDEERLRFVAPYLYREEDRRFLEEKAETLKVWSQVKNEAVTGPMTGAKLKVLPSSLATWEKWKKKHPETLVLSLDTGYDRDYSRDPYADYYESRRGFFGFFRGLFAGNEGKELVAGVKMDGRAKAYPLEKLRQLGKTTDTFAGKTLTFTFEPVTGDLEVTDDDGNRVPYITAYWFVWKETHPETELFGGIDN